MSDLLRTEIAMGSFADGHLPGEDALMKKYQVSRGVVRQVLALLSDQGLVERVRGAGTFALAPVAIRHEIGRKRDIADEVNVNGTRIAIRTTHIAVHEATQFVATMLDLREGDATIILESVTSLDGFPLSVRTAFLPHAPFARLVEDPLLDLDRSPYEIMHEVLGGPLGETDLRISASTADELTAAQLRVAVGFPLLDTTRTILSLTGRPLEYSVAHARADRLVFSTLLPSIS